jgi:hypothetical protein
MGVAGRTVEPLQMPVDDLVADIAGAKLVLGEFSVRDEILVLLHSYDALPTANILRSLERWKEGSIKNKLRDHLSVRI